MVRFECSRCGRCCINFGPYIIIERQLGGGQFSCHSLLTNEHFTARLSSSEGHFHPVRKREGGGPPCPFLAKEPMGERYLCMIYPTRPEFCQKFRCSHMDIFDSEGQRIGRVGGEHSLLSGDKGLLSVWDRQIAPLATGDNRSWLTQAQMILEGAGYRVVQYE